MTPSSQLDNLQGHLARPEGAGPWPAVIVIQEWWGLDPQIKDVADRVAGLGYLAFAPDLYQGELAEWGDGAKASDLARKFGPDAPDELTKLYDALKSHPDCTGRVGAVGFCFGGRMALALGIRRPLDAVCTFYGGGMQQLFGDLHKMKSPVLGLFGDADQSIPVGTVEQFDGLLDDLGNPHEIVVYPDSGHAFFKDTNPKVYKPDAAKDAWKRLTGFFGTYLTDRG